MKKILLFGAGKSATCLIEYLSGVCKEHDWRLVVADADADALNKKLAGLPAVEPSPVNVENADDRLLLIGGADLVISLLPPSLHILVARTCLALEKNLLTASYLDEGIRQLRPEIEAKGLFFLCEMGLDPGIDHMSAMLLINRIRDGGGKIISFRSHTGGLVAPESDDNPWHYKISWNPRNIVRAGAAGAVYKESGEIRQVGYQGVFDHPGLVRDERTGDHAFYPNRDSLAYMSLYGLTDADTFIRTTLRHPDFCRGWKALVAAGLTDDQQRIPDHVKTMADWSRPLLAHMDPPSKPLFDFLSLFENSPIPPGAHSSADLLQVVLERKWRMAASDKDMIVMLHELAYHTGGRLHQLKSSLVVTGEDSRHTAMARTVGLPLGIAATLVLEHKMPLKGLHIPIIPEIYLPVLKALDLQGIRFYDTVS